MQEPPGTIRFCFGGAPNNTFGFSLIRQSLSNRAFANAEVVLFSPDPQKVMEMILAGVALALISGMATWISSMVRSANMSRPNSFDSALRLASRAVGILIRESVSYARTTAGASYYGLIIGTSAIYVWGQLGPTSLGLHMAQSAAFSGWLAFASYLFWSMGNFAYRRVRG